MELKTRLYPYPVLCFYNNDYKTSKFKVEISDWKIKDNNIEVDFDIFLNNKELKELIVNGQAHYGIHAECPATSFRKFYKIDKEQVKINIDSGKVDGTIQFCFFIITSKEIRDFYSIDFHPVFSDLKFSFEKYNIIAISEQINVPIIKDYDELKNITSIFLIIPIYDDNQKSIMYDFYKDKIEIKVPHIQFDKYKSIKNIKLYQSIVHGLLIVPALINIFERLKFGNWDDYEYRWFYSIKNAVEKQGLNFDEDSFKAVDTINLVQQIIGNPILTSFDSLFEMSFSGGLDDYEN